MFKKNIFPFYLFCWFLLMISVHAASGLCGEGRFGPGCRYVCHCGDGSGSCNEETGRCLSGQTCARGFYGDNCQKENIALNKHASQRYTLTWNGFSYSASLGVDGNTSTNFDDKSCTHTRYSNAQGWWRVDLGQSFNIRYIRVYNSADYRIRLQGMRIYVRNVGLSLCYTGDDSTPPEVINITCTSTLRGRYVYIYSGHSDNILTLCEVQIFVCTDYWFGENCDKSCNCKNATELCDKVTGACTSGCPDGFTKTENCTIECDDHWFGENCVHTCNCRNEIDVCNKTSGGCTFGCAAGFEGDDCKTACTDYWFGDDCNQTCNCRDASEVCNKTTGVCLSGCAAGLQWDDCKTVCPSHWFGEDCNQTCNCRSERDVCNATTGACLSGCAAGFQDDDCKTKCGDYLYGENCVQTCNCRNETELCNKWNGACRSGCAAGFQGEDCNTACTNGQYGFECSESCDNCATSSTGERKCDHVIGQCNAGCIPGYKDIFCNHTCESGRYGIDCNIICSAKCKSVDNGLPICHHVTGTCTSGCQDGYLTSRESICSLAMSASANPESEAGFGAGLIAGIALGCFVAIILVAVLIVLSVRRKRCYSKETVHSETNGILFTTDTTSAAIVSQLPPELTVQLDIDGSNESDVDGPDAFLDVDGHVYSNELSLKTIAVNEGITLDKLWDYVVEQMRKGGLKAEYEKLPAGLIHSVSTALKPENKRKNRYQNIYAYDDTRIILHVPPGASHTDYINANYITGYKNPQKYIAAQGPIALTMDDFWRIIWQENCRKIVALTRLVEGGRIKCDQYWPDSGFKEYGDVRVEMIQVEEFPDFYIRTLMIEHTKYPDKRLLKQFHFLAWPDHGVPDYATALISFRDKVATTSSSTTGPIVVHCSAGIGRSGTFIGLDFLIEQAKAEGMVDIFGCINNMRNYRVNMIQTVEQYEFLYDALLEALNLSHTSLISSEFMDKYAMSNKVNCLSGKTYLQEQFDLLNLLSPSAKPGDYKSAELEENKDKHRDPSVMAVDSHRVYLSLSTTDTSNYINAVFLPAYKESKPYIVTQVPLADTVIDFWRMIYDNKCHTIVMLNNDNIEADACYWPRDGTALSIGSFTITADLDTVCDTYDVMSLELTHEDKADEVLKIRQYQCKFWLSSEIVPADADAIIAVLNNVTRWQQEDNDSTIVVHCMNGAERSGVYCTISAVIDRLKMEQQVNISQIVKRFRKCRPQIISSLYRPAKCGQSF